MVGQQFATIDESLLTYSLRKKEKVGSAKLCVWDKVISTVYIFCLESCLLLEIRNNAGDFISSASSK